MNWLAWKAKLSMLGAGLLVILGFFVRLKVVTSQRDKARVKADTYKAQNHQAKVRAKVIKTGKDRVESHRVELINELKKSEEDFKGIDNLSDPNDF